MRGSLIIVGFFVLGIVCGVMHWLPDLNAWGNVSFWTLCALLFCVGVTVGNNTALLKSFRQLDPRLMLLPLMVKYFGPLAPISSGGATTMDTTLPIITRCSGQDFVIVSLFHGFLVDFSVPFLVTFFSTV